MLPEVLIILEIVRLSLEITLKVIEGIPVAEREKIFMEHQRNTQALIAFFVGLLPPPKPLKS